MTQQNMLPFEAERNPIVRIVDGEAWADSRDVAAYFGKRHQSVMESYRNLHCSDHFRRTNYRVCEEKQELSGGGATKSVHVEMTKDGFAFLVMGFTGAKAGAFKEKYIEAFNTMEAELRNSIVDPIAALNDAATLRQLLLGYTEQVQKLEHQVAEQQPKVEALERISEADGSLCVTDAAKTLQVPPNRLFKWLDANGWTYIRPGTSARIAYQSKLNAGYLEHKLAIRYRDDGSERTFTQVRVTAKGLTCLAQVFPPAVREA